MWYDNLADNAFHNKGSSLSQSGGGPDCPAAGQSGIVVFDKLSCYPLTVHGPVCDSAASSSPLVSLAAVLCLFSHCYILCTLMTHSMHACIVCSADCHMLFSLTYSFSYSILSPLLSTVHNILVISYLQNCHK